MSQPLVKNAADRDQTKSAGTKAERIRNDELKDLREVLSTESGKRFVWRLLSHCKTFESIWEPSARIHYLAGIQDVGHFIMAEVAEADERFLIEMMKEKINKEKV